MSIEGRLEALTHTLELVAHMQRDFEAKHEAFAAETDARLNRLAASLEETNAVVSGLAHDLAETNAVVRNLSEVTADFNRSIANVVLDHAALLHKLEHPPQ